MIRSFEMQRSSGTKLEGVVYSDGSVAVRQLCDDPCSRITFTFEGVSECEAELGIVVPTGLIDHQNGDRVTRIAYSSPVRDRATTQLGVGYPLRAKYEPEPEDVEA